MLIAIVTVKQTSCSSGRSVIFTLSAPRMLAVCLNSPTHAKIDVCLVACRYNKFPTSNFARVKCQIVGAG